mmetsp:Transcript_3086/g.8485  ORF Transcript_3086/g.8485 Transcript_3086/m.8485 type:complete len:347 (+) Transcript_3086:149-1189(+)
MKASVNNRWTTTAFCLCLLVGFETAMAGQDIGFVAAGPQSRTYLRQDNDRGKIRLGDDARRHLKKDDENDSENDSDKKEEEKEEDVSSNETEVLEEIEKELGGNDEKSEESVAEETEEEDLDENAEKESYAKETEELEEIEKELEGEEENEKETEDEDEDEDEDGEPSVSEDKDDEDPPTDKPTHKPTNKPTHKPTHEPEDLETVPPQSAPPTAKPYTSSDEDPVKEEDEEHAVEEELQELETQFKKEEKVAREAGGFGIFFGIIAMIFTAHQMSENPDGIYASVCRLAITISTVIIKIVCMPCRKVMGVGGNGNPYSGHMPISTSDYSYRNDPYRSNANAGFEMS